MASIALFIFYYFLKGVGALLNSPSLTPSDIALTTIKKKKPKGLQKVMCMGSDAPLSRPQSPMHVV